jgi:hypothetical protein
LDAVVCVGIAVSKALKACTARARPAALDQWDSFGAAVAASACPDIATSIAIDAAKARFFVMAVFPCSVKIPARGDMRIAA